MRKEPPHFAGLFFLAYSDPAAQAGGSSEPLTQSLDCRGRRDVLRGHDGRRNADQERLGGIKKPALRPAS
jgi:hypothetical protein